MKKIKYIACLLSLAVVSGCDSILDKGPLDSFTNDNFWTGEGNNGNGYGDFYFKTLSDDQAGMSFAKWTYPDNAPSTSATWKNGWIEVRRANIMLENVPTVASLDEATKNHWLGVARLMRAWQYYHLVRMYGNLPWIDKALNINDEGEIYGNREDRDMVMDKVLEDLDVAVTNIKDISSKKKDYSCTPLSTTHAHPLKSAV